MKRKRRQLLRRDGKPLKHNRKIQNEAPREVGVHLEIYRSHKTSSCKNHPEEEARYLLRKIHDVYGIIKSEFICDACREKALQEMMNAKDPKVQS